VIVSAELVHVFNILVTSGRGWMTNAEVGRRLPTVAPRTVRAHTRRLARASVLEWVEAFPEYGYRVADPMPVDAAAVVAKIRAAAEVISR
jgi:hypothetical protein